MSPIKRHVCYVSILFCIDAEVWAPSYTVDAEHQMGAKVMQFLIYLKL